MMYWLYTLLFMLSTKTFEKSLPYSNTTKTFEKSLRYSNTIDHAYGSISCLTMSSHLIFYFRPSTYMIICVWIINISFGHELKFTLNFWHLKAFKNFWIIFKFLSQFNNETVNMPFLYICWGPYVTSRHCVKSFEFVDPSVAGLVKSFSYIDASGPRLDIGPSI